MARVPGRDDMVKVKMWLYSAASTNDRNLNFVGTKVVIREYNYLRVGKLVTEDKLEIHHGIWIRSHSGVDSRKDHPDYYISFPRGGDVKRQSLNPGLQPEIVDALLGESWAGQGVNTSN